VHVLVRLHAIFRYGMTIPPVTHST